MTKTERATRSVLANYLRSQGYATYASLLLKFDLNFYRPAPGEFFAAAMIPGKYTIYINPAVNDKEALSTFIRHEILHEYLKHYDRSLRHLASRAGLDYDELDDLSLNGIKDELEFTHDLQNIAGDYEISNRGYTENDKEIMRNLGKFLGLGDDVKGLVTEDDHPEWVNLPIEDMYDKLLDELEESKKKMEDMLKKIKDFLPPGGDPPPPGVDPPPMPPTGGGDPPLPPTGGGGGGGDIVDPPPMPPTGGGGGDSMKRVIHHGTFIDDHTFVDEDGNVYDLANPK